MRSVIAEPLVDSKRGVFMFMILGLIVGSAVSGLIVGLFVMLAGKLLLKEAPEFGDAFKACFFAALVGAIVQFGLEMALADSSVLLLVGISLLASYVIYVILFQTIIGYTMGQAAAVAAVALGVMFVIMLGVGIVIGILAAAAGA
ncbi:MAG: hypothetical protein JJ974_01845 [Phycisphaerales bacterium]|nr:hypothetical protein [Phycisphaerales bacterium]